MLQLLAALKYRTPLLFFFSKAPPIAIGASRAFWKNAPQAPLPNVRSSKKEKRKEQTLGFFAHSTKGRNHFGFRDRFLNTDLNY